MKSFPFSVSKIELDTKGHRLYAQGINDPFIHSIEITSGVVIQSIGDSHVQCIVDRQTFAVSTCDSILFKSNGASKIVCWNQLNNNDVHTLKLPISGGRAFISSLMYHPTKFSLVCTIYGDTKGTCLLLMGYENEKRMQQPLPSNQHVNHCDDKESNERIEIPSPKKFVPATRTFSTFGNILNRIDDLFALAMNSPNCTDDYKQRKQLEISLQQLKAPIQLLSSDINGSEQVFDSTHSTEAENNERPLNTASKSAELTESSSTQSNNTFTLEKVSKSDIDVAEDNDDDDANDDHTFNVENSDQNSNATLETENERSSFERSICADVGKKTTS